MRIIFIYGGAAAGKLTIARELAARTGYRLFHNHLIVDAVAALFEFGSEPFVRLREAFWMEAMEEAARRDISLIFTFAPENSVAPDFPGRLRAMIERHDGELHFVRLTLDRAEQERRIDNPSRHEFGKLKSVELLRTLTSQFEAAMAAMPEPALSIDTQRTPPAESARMIAESLRLPHTA